MTKKGFSFWDYVSDSQKYFRELTAPVTADDYRGCNIRPLFNEKKVSRR